MDELEGLTLALKMEIEQQWGEQITAWNSILPTSTADPVPVNVPPSGGSSHGLLNAEDMLPHPVFVSASQGGSAVGASSSDMTAIIQERDSLWGQCRRLRNLSARQKEAIRKLCFWLEQCSHSFTLTVPPCPPWWQEADVFLAKHYPAHTPFAALPPAPQTRIVLTEPNAQQQRAGVQDFVETVVPRAPWPVPRPVTAQDYADLAEQLRVRQEEVAARQTPSRPDQSDSQQPE